MEQITNFEKVGDFMEAFGQEVLYMPVMPNTNLAALRLDLINEEVQELRDGLGKKSMLEIADALTDIFMLSTEQVMLLVLILMSVLTKFIAAI